MMLVFLLAAGGFADAQTADTAVVSGTIHDQTGAVLSGATVTAGSHAFRFEPTEPGTAIGCEKVSSSIERAKAIPWQPIHSS